MGIYMNVKKNKYIDLAGNIGEILIPLVIYYLTYLLSYIILTTLVTKIVQPDIYVSERETTIRSILGGLSMLIGVLPLLPGLKRETDSRREQDMQGKSVKRVPLYVSVPITITLAITSSAAINTLFILFGLTGSSEAYSHVAERQYSVSLALGLLLYGVFSPVAEEVVFRGLIYNRIRKKSNIHAAVLLSALIFGLYHGNIVQGSYGFLMGILIACTYEWSGSFLNAFLFHAAANVSVCLITSNEVLYNLIITPYVCVVFIIISAVLLMRMKKVLF